VDSTTDPVLLARRRLLARLGALGVTLGVGPPLLRRLDAIGEGGAGGTGAARVVMVSPDVPGQAAQVTPDLTLDTMAGIVAFAVPGDDDHSRHQGVAPAEPGGVAAEAPRLLADTLNTYLPAPEVLAFLVEALQTELAAVPLPGGLNGLTWLEQLLETDASIPLAPVQAILTNLVAVQVDPSSVAGPFLTPFPRLSWAEKAEVWRRLENDLPALFTIGDPESRLPLVSDILDLLSTLGGFLRFAAGAVLEVAVFASYSEFGVFDPATRTLTGRPVGWELADYPPTAPVEGWDELIGYYQGRTTADA
jgi:hypothetical protein